MQWKVSSLNVIPRFIAPEGDSAVGKVIITMRLYARAIQAMQEDTVNSIRKKTINNLQMILFFLLNIL